MKHLWTPRYRLRRYIEGSVPAAAAPRALTDLPGCAPDTVLGALGFTNVGCSTRTLDAKPKHRSAVPAPEARPPPRPTLRSV